jgi:hypothetical protein
MDKMSIDKKQRLERKKHWQWAGKVVEKKMLN